MTNLIIGPLLRHVTETTATIWMETDGPCVVEILGHRAGTFHVAGHHYALVVVRDLEPGCAVAYDIRLDGDVCWPTADTDMPPTVLTTLRPAPAACGRPWGAVPQRRRLPPGRGAPRMGQAHSA